MTLEDVCTNVVMVSATVLVTTLAVAMVGLAIAACIGYLKDRFFK